MGVNLLTRIRSVPHLPARVVLILSALGFGIALAGLWWDGAWHQTFPFEEFWSPPHLVLYAGILLALFTAAGAVLDPVRRAFDGPSFPLPLLAVRFPVGLFLLALGTLLALFSGMVDSVWHASLKGGESAYSLPHNLTISGGILAALGILSGALLLRDKTDLDQRILPWGILAFGAGLMAGLSRYIGNFSVLRADALASLNRPALQVDLQSMALRRTVLDWNWTTDNALWAPLPLALAMATSLAMVQRLRPGGWSATGTVLLLLGGLLAFTAAVLLGGQNPAYRFSLALALPMAVVADVVERWRPDRAHLRWALAGVAFAATHAAVFGLHPAGALLGVGGAVAGGWGGRALEVLVLRPTPKQMAVALLAWAVLIPVAVGGLDILLRYGTYWWLL